MECFDRFPVGESWNGQCLDQKYYWRFLERIEINIKLTIFRAAALCSQQWSKLEEVHFLKQVETSCACWHWFLLHCFFLSHIQGPPSHPLQIRKKEITANSSSCAHKPLALSQELLKLLARGERIGLFSFIWQRGSFTLVRNSWSQDETLWQPPRQTWTPLIGQGGPLHLSSFCMRAC